MKVRLTLALALTAALLIVAPALAAPIDARALKSASSLEFTASTTLFDAEGTFHSWKVIGKVDPETFENSDVRVVIDAASIDTDNDTRDEHLRNPDFFHVSKFRHLKFESTTIKPAAGQGRYDVSGEFTIKETTKQVSIPVTIKRGRIDGKDTLRVTGKWTVDRFEYGLDYEAGMFEPDLDREVEIRFDLVFAI